LGCAATAYSDIVATTTAMTFVLKASQTLASIDEEGVTLADCLLWHFGMHSHHASPSVIGQDFELVHLANHFIVEIVDVLEQDANHDQ